MEWSFHNNVLTARVHMSVKVSFFKLQHWCLSPYIQCSSLIMNSTYYDTDILMYCLLWYWYTDVLLIMILIHWCTAYDDIDILMYCVLWYCILMYCLLWYWYTADCPIVNILALLLKIDIHYWETVRIMKKSFIIFSPSL